MTATAWIVLAHAFATVAMAGLIWFVQVVHYPLFAGVGGAGFAAYARAHARRTRLVVAPLMAIEAATACWLLARPLAPDAAAAAQAGVALLLVVWLSTVCLQAPCHRRLAAGYDQGIARRLVRTNWIRTAAWTARAALALWLVGAALAPQ